MLQGNNVKVENAKHALFAELGPAPSTMEAATGIDAYGAMPGNCTQQSDGRQAYTQALYKGINHGRAFLSIAGQKPASGRSAILSLYGHPDSGVSMGETLRRCSFLPWLYSLEHGLPHSGTQTSAPAGSICR